MTPAVIVTLPQDKISTTFWKFRGSCLLSETETNHTPLNMPYYDEVHSFMVISNCWVLPKNIGNWFILTLLIFEISYLDLEV